jgi:hypothetical protein
VRGVQDRELSRFIRKAVKRPALLRDVTGMMPTRPAANGEARSGWWPSKYGAEDQAGALASARIGGLVISHAKLRGATGAWVAPLAIV